MRTRKHTKRSKYTESSDSDDSFNEDDEPAGDDDDDSDFEYVSQVSKSKSSSSKKSSSAPKPGSKSKSLRKKNMSGVLDLRLAPKTFSDIPTNSLTTDPANNQRRFIPYDDIKDKILRTSEYFLPNEAGIMTFLPGFQAGDPKHLEYFGLTSELQKTELSKIKQMSDDELKSELERINTEINKIPSTENPTSISIPGYSTNLKDSIAINADIREFDWKRLGSVTKFDVIVMDPPWQITFSTVTRGVQLSYEQLEHTIIANMPLHLIQDNGFMFMWVVASQLMNGIAMMKNWGYRIVETINWVKVSKSGIYLPSHGYYFQHNKETVLVGLKGDPPEEMNKEAFRSLIVGPREVRQSQKPAKLYEMIEEMFPGMMYLEVFARPHNLRDGWVSIGIELPT
ncbi:MT-A70 family protein [Tritrichomonas foetus]|uniref:mRNA m(6)A methyltransferase n=1 Tax=Tritrichomonas foetus TaxID=1144522 RepID=A0A1J4J9E4_9EUKA|nr:MT-A70 family protein [Tritrichomonas foetus]|eukprot:OHS94871.1 MT-A70 family protein [Tritrichomonas foetus]